MGSHCLGLSGQLKERCPHLLHTWHSWSNLSHLKSVRDCIFPWSTLTAAPGVLNMLCRWDTAGFGENLGETATSQRYCYVEADFWWEICLVLPFSLSGFVFCRPSLRLDCSDILSHKLPSLFFMTRQTNKFLLLIDEFLSFREACDPGFSVIL